MIKVALIGRGNLSFHLAKVFRTIEKIEVTVHNSREKLPENVMKSIDVCIIAVSDSAIKGVSEKLRGIKAIVAHTSGNVSINQLPNDCRRGVFYPLQTFSKEKEVGFSDIPICIEAESQKDINALSELAGYISKKVQEVSSTQRKSLHLAAVFANNFTNHLFQIAHEICNKNDLSFDLIKPLILETANKMKTLSPFEAQTGPARRHDSSTINDHEELLKDSDRKKIYEQLTQSIRRTYEQKL